MPDFRAPVEAQVLALALAQAQSLLASVAPPAEARELPLWLDEQSALLAGVLAEALLAADLAGRVGVAARLPAVSPAPSQQPAPSPPGWQVEALARAVQALAPELQARYLGALPPAVGAAVAARLGPPPAPAELARAAGEAPPEVQLPVIEAAVRDLQARGLLSWSDYKAASAGARAKALAALGEVSEAARGKLQELLVTSMSEGTGRRELARQARAELGEALTGAQLETTLRTAIAEGYASGQEAVLADPLVGEAFPYVETLGIPDSRQSDVCALAGRSGIGGTAVYRRDDPAWQRIRPPRHPNCRCSASPLTVAMAARKGVAEAIRWRETGVPPADRAWVELPRKLLELSHV